MTYPKAQLRGMTAALAAAAALCLGAPAAAGEVAAVLSSDSGPYGEAFAGFRGGLGESFDIYDLSKPGTETPEDATHVAAFGAKASAREYPPGTHLVSVLTPVSGKGRLWHEISMLPAPDAAVAAYLKLQPGLRRLAIFWTAYPGERYLEELRQAGKAAGLEIISARLKGPDAFPERLRYLLSRMDAFWLMPDPALITQSSLLVLANFSCANSIPFYAPTRALVASGATASFAPDFKAAGAAAAKGIALMRSGQQLPAVTYVDNPQLQLNTELAEKCRWPIKIK